MKKILFFIFMICLGLTINVDAQKIKPIKKAPPKIKIVAPEEAPLPPPPPKKLLANPIIMESQEATNFRKQRFCSDCDTLILAPEKKHILIYDVKWMANSEAQTYKKQPTESDLKKDYYALKEENKREWDELQQNFSPQEYIYHYIYRNTYIEIPNKQHQILNLLDRKVRHEGFLFWTGKELDSIITRKNMSLLTEVVSEQTGQHKKSSYYKKFVTDSLTIVNLQKTSNPSANLSANMNTILMREAFGSNILPLQFFNLSKVSKVTLSAKTKGGDMLVLNLNKNGQLTEVIDKHNGIVITYKDNLPILAKSPAKTLNFYYRNDTLIIKGENYLKVNKLIGNVFFNVKNFRTEERDYSNLTLEDGLEIQLTNDGGNTCLSQANTSEGSATKQCYSNTRWQLPLTITNVSAGERYDFTSTASYSENDNILVVEDLNKAKSTKIQYGLVDGKPTTITSAFKRGEAEYSEPFLVNVNYEYYK
ncbi:hypothetical protein EZJ43_08015 [Pedobacter changchengzhani]|uniref:Uncharacterized protein n=1 Tax=Pedobacter changchengzhani TaxID=2529274 RepID=A0A4R5ML84_9SPHI|nr:hypothetical protein [Pedobacter changchengzhani]TDG36454.1 hypothetical protein EZJ43_08015 [Pedobacter changchengzhani]